LTWLITAYFAKEGVLTEKARSATIPTRMITSPLTNVIMRDAEQKSISSLILE
jgi:hypothetical protein